MEQIVKIARKMRAIFLEEQKYGKLPVAINTKKFSDTVAKHTGYEIVSLTLNMPPALRGLLLRKEKNIATIIVNDSNNECWRRFTFVKELSHLFLEAQLEFTTDALKVAKCLVDDGIDDPALYRQEVSGVRAALEIMIPEDLKTYIAHLANVERATPYAIASKLKVPEKYVEYRLSQWGYQINHS